MYEYAGSTTTDREQCRLAEKGNPTYIFTIPRAILPKPSLCDEITATKTCNEIIASRSVHLARSMRAYVHVLYMLTRYGE